MFQYLLKRILLFLPTLLLVSLLSFGLSRLSPGDPVADYLEDDVFGKISTPNDLRTAERSYAQAAAALHLDKPAFYFSLNSQAYPDTLYRIFIGFRRETLEKLAGQYGNWPMVQSWYNGIRSFDLKILSLPDSLRAAATPIKQPLKELYTSYKEGAVTARLNEMERSFGKNPVLDSALGTDFFTLKKNYESLKAEAKPSMLRTSSFHWYGFDNQYHTWLMNFLRGDFGTSLHKRQTVTKQVKPALFWTLVVNIAAIFLAFMIAVPLGIWSAVKRGKKFDKITSAALFMLYSLPAFWVATMLLVFFTNPQYGMDIFPGKFPDDIPVAAPWWRKIWLAAPHLILPIFCLTYPVVAYIARQARGGMANVLGQDFIRTARAKGLSERSVIWKHGFRNALFPLITLVASVLPTAIAGSVAVEVIFNIPGMGWLTFNAIAQKDWPIVFTVLMLGSVLTVAGMLLADILYALVDPRVKFDN
ncbi:MAG: ABC transporter permease subunit [Bacteroidetes bacterium]|nr:ABC transporter permease subunit [Bacteroidota bacterium]